MASTYLTKSSYGTPTSTKIFTFSCWVKKAKIGSGRIFDFYSAPFSYSNGLFFTGSDQLGLGSGDNNNGRIITNRVFRDTSGWYHIVAVQDTTNATASDRLKLYVNGVRETSFSASVDAILNADYQAFRSDVGGIGTYFDKSTASEFFDGSMAHVHFIDGTAYDASTFGETDATTGIWKPIFTPVVTYGTNGFFLKFENSASFGTDSSGNANNFTVNGTMTQTIDTPSNVFATMNPVDRSGGTVTTFSNGNLNVKHAFGTNGAVCAQRSTLAISKGKWYWEAKCIATGGDVRLGICSMSSTNYATLGNPYYSQECYNYKQTGEKGIESGDSAYGATYTANDILGVAYDADNGSLTFYKNGVSQGVAFSGLNTSLTWGAWSSEYNNGEYAYNFGNGYFGTTAVSSAENPDDGIGIFEYPVPAGYKALCTKSINAQEYN